jgi:hypothetical protein
MKPEAAVFVYRYKGSDVIHCEYVEDTKSYEGSPQWEHIATLDPRLWIQAHWKLVEEQE